MARLASSRGACIRRQVGCILTNHLNHVIATGYNGRARGVRNCLESPCGGAGMASGTGLEQCEAIHAEANALLQCRDVEAIKTAYCTASPCIHCTKLLMNTGCERIVFSEYYPGHEECGKLWEESGDGRSWELFSTQFEMFSDDLAPQCEHKEWKPSPRQTRSDDTVYRQCADCGLLKEVCI
ncbi:MAG: cytidine deaminase [Acidimicrobiia bacterium]|nr:cytidine deaminase [Acidimicrobiia bacterium]